jgi:hypothetical protein
MNRLPKCKYHKEKFVPKYPFQKFCLSDDECIKAFNEWVKEEKEKKKAKANKDFEIAEIKDKEEKKLKASLINTKTQVHAYVRNRDKGKPCISCGTNWNQDFQCGHHYKSETFITLRFNLDNLHGQCRRCNLHLEGAFDNYALNLPNRIGIERYNKLVELASVDKQFDKVWNVDNLKEVRMLLKENKSYEVKQT